MTRRVALVVTSHGRFEGSGRLTGLWHSEFSRVHQQCLKARVEPVVVSVAGGRVPLDPNSLKVLGAPTWLRRRDESPAALEHTRRVSDLDPDSLDGIYLAGGHGAIFDFPTCRALSDLVSGAIARGIPVASVCHGPAGLLAATTPDGEPVVSGRRVTCLSWREEGLLGSRPEMPFNLQAELVARGADMAPPTVPFAPHVVVDGALITGANPASAAGVGRALLRQVAGRR